MRRSTIRFSWLALGAVAVWACGEEPRSAEDRLLEQRLLAEQALEADRFRDAVGHLEKALELASPETDAFSARRVGERLSVAALLAGDRAVARRAYEWLLGEESGKVWPDRWPDHAVLNNLAVLDALDGRLEDAEARLGEALGPASGTQVRLEAELLVAANLLRLHAARGTWGAGADLAAERLRDVDRRVVGYRYSPAARLQADAAGLTLAAALDAVGRGAAAAQERERVARRAGRATPPPRPVYGDHICVPGEPMRTLCYMEMPDVR